MEMNEIKLETERLLLRWFREDDFPGYVEIATDEEKKEGGDKDEKKDKDEKDKD